jgi:hypothetical protein
MSCAWLSCKPYIFLGYACIYWAVHRQGQADRRETGKTRHLPPVMALCPHSAPLDTLTAGGTSDRTSKAARKTMQDGYFPALSCFCHLSSLAAAKHSGAASYISPTRQRNIGPRGVGYGR